MGVNYLEKQSIYRRILAIAVPITLQNLINVGVSVTDTLMIGGISEVQLSGIAQANQPYFIFTTLIFGLAAGSMVLTSQYWGKKNLPPIRAILGLMIRIGVICGILAGVLVLSKPFLVMSVFTNDAEVINYGAEYLKIVGYSYIFSAFTGIFLIGLRSIENVKISMYIYGISFGLNVFLNWVFIFGHLGLKPMEIKGAALATLISRILEFVLTVIYIYFIEKQIRFRFKDLFRGTSRYWRTLTRYSVPVLFSELNWGLGISVQAAIIGHLGVSVLAASSFINVVQQLAGVAIMGVGAAASILIGTLIGEGEEEKALDLSRLLMKISLIIAGVIALSVILFRPIAPNFIKASGETAVLIKSMLFVSAYMLFFQSLNVVTLAGILRGSGDTVFCASLDVATLWFIKLGLGLLSAVVFKIHPVWVYFILSSDEFLKAVITTPRVLRGKWIYHTTVH
ncbi:MATE family efflux transporter [Clostridium polynesiense]|uniref:MATE family efflux transporter n=1 Tax=Clostridium polynesiense TaxID=1325933 RepID=UPI0006932983|nr:MATE family efflux transporter [Clostridium polynesiense]